MGRKPSTIIRIEIVPPRATIYIGRQLWYDLGKPERLALRRNRGGTNWHELILQPKTDLGFLVTVPFYQMPRIHIGADYAHELGIVSCTLAGSYDPDQNLVSCDLLKPITN